jgi:hypothetical protein
MATGQRPPEPIKDIDELKDSIVAGIKEANPALLRANPGIADIIARCLRHDPNDRVRDADYLLLELQLFHRFTDTPTISSTAEKIVREAAKLPGTDDDLFRLIAAGELYKQAQRLECMAGGVYDLSGEHEDIVSGLTRYLSVLGTGDEYLAVTIPQFWTTKNLGINGRFLTMNRMLAERGVKIRRLFLVTKKELAHRSPFRKVAEAHLRMQAELPSGVTVDSRFKIVSAAEQWDEVRQNRHLGAWIKGGAAMTIVPVYDWDKVIRNVRMRPYQGTPDHLRKELSRYIDGGRPLLEAFPDLPD